MLSYNKLSTDRSLYVHLSKAKYQSILITDDKYTLEQNLIRNQENKLNAHDILKAKIQTNPKETVSVIRVLPTQDKTLKPQIKSIQPLSKDQGLEL